MKDRVDSLTRRGIAARSRRGGLSPCWDQASAIFICKNVELAEEIIERGAILSELHSNTLPKGQNLMARDRIISGLSRAIIVVEASEKSGSLDTASKAIKQGRLVYAVPEPIGCWQVGRSVSIPQQ